ncbi:MAG TPA: hypothetical protein VGA52_02325 [Anaerolineales bacterium]
MPLALKQPATWLAVAVSLLPLGLAACSTPNSAAQVTAGRRPAVRVTWQLHQEQQGLAVAAFDPVELRISQEGQAAWSPLDLHPVAEMRTCVAWDAPCTPNGAWLPYQLTIEVALDEYPAANGQLWLGAAFRQRDGLPLEAFVDPLAPQRVIQVPLTVDR